jgi:beta-mannanase
MKYLLAIYAVLLSLFLTQPTWSAPARAAANVKNLFSDRKVLFGVYDPHLMFTQDRDVNIEHIFVYWQALDLAKLRQLLSNASERGRAIMVTIEPYTHASDWRSGGERLFSDITSGAFQKEIKTVCAELGGAKNQVLVRWGQEMEDPTGRYPWARTDSEGFKTAFRYFVAQCRHYAPDALFVWSPKGEKNLANYYPGDEFVDVVGVSLYGLQKMDKALYGGAREFPETFDEKYRRVAAFHKPVIIAELGVSGDKGYRDRWFASLFSNLASSSAFQRLRAVIYFDDKEPHYWPMGFGSPDWRISLGWFSKAKQALQQRVPPTEAPTASLPACGGSPEPASC